MVIDFTKATIRSNSHRNWLEILFCFSSCLSEIKVLQRYVSAVTSLSLSKLCFLFR